MAQQSILPTVNFLRRKRQRLQVQQKRDRVFLLGSGVFLGITLFVLLGIFGAWFWLRQQVGDLEARQQQNDRVVRQLAQTEAEYMLFAKRLDLLDGIFSTRISQQRTLAFLAGLRTNGVRFQGINYDPVQKAVSFQAVAQDITRFDAFVNVLRTPEVQEEITNLEVAQVGRNELGEYSMEVSFRLTQET
jgi:hypothetical protein